MVVTVGKVVDGKIEVDSQLPEGKTVGVIINDNDSEGFDLPSDDEAELLDRLQSTNAGHVIDGDEHLSKLRAEL